MTPISSMSARWCGSEHVSGRHRKQGRGLPPLISGAGIAAVLVATVVLARPADIPDQPLPFPAPVLQLTPPQAAPDTTTTQAETTAPTSFAPLSTSLSPTSRPPAVTSAPVVPTAKPAPPVLPASAPQSRLCEGLGVAASVKVACNLIIAAVPGITVIGGRAARPNNPSSCHPRGLALDFMTYRDKALGDRIVAFVRANKTLLGVTTILWQVPAHHDHVHLSFSPCNH